MKPLNHSSSTIGLLFTLLCGTSTIACGAALDEDDLFGRADSALTTGGVCPPGQELEQEHGATFCKDHGGGKNKAKGKNKGGAKTSDDAVSSEGGSANASDDLIPAGATLGAPLGEIVECLNDTDCEAGLECEVEEEHGAFWSFCQPHSSGKNKNKGGN